MKPKPEFSHPIHELLQKRWSPRSFAPLPVEEEKTALLFEAARWAASANNEQPWRFIYAARSDAKRFEKLFECLAETNKVWVKTAPLLILTLVKTQFSGGSSLNRWAFHDLGLAIGNLTTQASALDLYVHNMAGFSVEKARQLFAIPEEFEPVTMIAVGYLGSPDQLPENLKKREIAQQQRRAMKESFLE